MLAWLITVVLHIAIDSVNVASITVAGIHAPIASTTRIDPPLIVLVTAVDTLICTTAHGKSPRMTKNRLGQTTRRSQVGRYATSVVSMLGLLIVFTLSLML